MFKKALSLLLSLMLVVTTLSVTALSVSAASTYVVAGSETLCGVNWVADAPENEMTDKGDGTYEKVYADVVAGTYQLKVVENATTWYGAADGGNVTFVVNDTCDVTVSFDPATQTITVTGDAVELPTSIEIESMRAVGAGDGAWLNGIGWDPAADENLMTEVAPLVYEITYEDIEAFDGYQFKFAANGDWTHNWGLEVAGAVTAGETELAYNGQNMTLATTYDLSNVTLRIDLSNFDYSTKKGAKMTVTVVDAEAPVEPTTAEPTEAPTTEAPTEAPTTVAPTEAPTTAAPTEVVSGLTVNATSNVFPSSVVTFSEDDTQVTITYFIESSKHMLNSQWKLSYDPAVLKVDPAKNMTASQDAWNFMPMASDAIVNLAPAAEPAGTILCNCTSVRLYKIANQRAPFVSVTFDVIGSGDTTVDLFVDVLTLSELDMSTLMTDTSKEETVVDLGVINSSSTAIKSVDTVVYEGAYNPVATNPVEQPTTVAPTTAAPTTEAPTTEVPTTEAPTTEEPTTAPVPGDATYVVAGSEELTGFMWVGDPVAAPVNVMAKDGDVYTLTFADAQPMTGAQIKVVENLADGTQNWIGNPDGSNVTFDITDVCDVTVTFNPATQAIEVTGTGVKMVTDLEVESMRAVGAGDGAWLNGIAWDPAADENLMTEITDGVYTITYEDVEAFDGYQFKFAANGSWTDNWGLAEAGAVTVGETALTYNGQNMSLATTYELSDVTLTIDLTNFNYADKSGAKMFIEVVDANGEEPEPTTTEEPTTEAPTTEAPTTEEPTTAPVLGDATYVVAGSEELTGFMWVGDPAAAPTNVMTKDGDVYTLTFVDAQPMTGAQIKVVENLADGTQNWIGNPDGSNVTFDITDVCDVTVTFNPATQAIEVTGTGVKMVTDLEVESMRTVGAGDGAWLNGIAWDPAADENLMTEITDGVYTITYEDVEAFDGYQFKFAANGSWTDNWGLAEAGAVTAGETALTYNGQNMSLATTYELSDVTITIDLTNFNYADKSGAKMFIEIVDANGEEPEPTTTEEPTTEAPTTEEPTTAPVLGDATYVVAGSEELTGFMWVGDPAAAPTNVMTKDGDVYTLTFVDAQPMTGAQIKVVENLADGTQNWIGNPDGSNVTFDITDVCDVTVTFNPATQAIEVTGTGVKMVTDLEVESMRTVGAGDGAWLNGIAWDPAADENLMTEITDGVYTITYEDVEAFDGYQFKFAANGSWADNWGLEVAGAVTEGETALKYNGENMSLSTTYELSDVTITIDLTNFNYADKSGAKMFIEVVDASGSEPEPTTVEPTTEAPTTEEPTTEAPTTEEPTTVPANALDITATSNLFPEATKTVEVADGETFVTVKYIVSEDMKLMNTQWVLNYDSTKLVPVAELNENMMPFATVGAMYVAEDGKIAGSCSSLNLYDIASGMSFVEATFKVVGTGETTVELVVEDLIASERNADGTSDETKEVVYVQAGEVAKTIVANTEIVVNAPVVEPTTVAPTTEAPVTEPTTVAPETEPTTEAPATEPTTEAGSTAAPDEDATSATDSTVKPGTADTPEAPDSNAVQTGNASMAIIILLVLVSASGVLFFARKRVK